MKVAAMERPALAILEARSLAKAYRGRAVVKDVSLRVESAQVVGLLGPNGAGKTTCFYMIVGIVAADAGDITIDGDSIIRLPMHRRARRGIGYLPQEASIFRRMSVGDNLMSILETRRDLKRRERAERRDQLLEEFHVSHLRDSLGQALSGGERRRVEIARALAMEPRFILLDEPFAGVDPISVGDIKDIIRHLQKRGIGVLITDHNVRDTLDICETAYIVGEGHIIAEGSPEEVLGNADVRKVYLGENFRL
jgi:lipopolysaccharide export system ATP-binding protein